MEIVIASHNKDKIEEIKSILAHPHISFSSLLDYPDCPPVIEDGKTYLENALKKAKNACAFTGKVALADDSGLDIPALNNEPGLFSARYAGDKATYKENINKVIEKLKGLQKKSSRKAIFKCVIVLYYPDGAHHFTHGSCEGEIIFELRGLQGFGYDPIFYVPELKKTFAELSKMEKNKISHRSIALNKMKKNIALPPGLSQ